MSSYSEVLFEAGLEVVRTGVEICGVACSEHLC